MSLLNDIERDAPTSTGAIFRELVDGRDQKAENPQSWSIAELRLSDVDVALLGSWLSWPTTAIAISSAISRGWSKALDPQSEYRNPEVLGLVLHTLYAEHVRRHGSEGNYWGAVNNLNWIPEVRDALFVANGQPNQHHRRLLEQAAQGLRLRNAFGIEGTFQWFSTGFLQFGFTKRGADRRLPEWLAHSASHVTAIEALVAPGGSSSFASFWDGLCAFRRGNISEPQLRQRLASSPWVLASWHDDLVRNARKRLHLGTGATGGDGDDAVLEFLSEPVLKFDEAGEPFFESELSGIAEIDLVEPSYRVTVGGREAVILAEQEDGTYSQNTRQPIPIDWRSQVVDAAIESTGSQSIVLSQRLVCWRAEEPIHVFRENGVRYRDPEHLGAPRGILHLWHPEALALDGEILGEWRSEGWVISRIRADGDVKLTVDGEVFWSLLDSRRRREQGAELNVWVSFSASQDGQADVRFHLPSDFGLRWARAGLEHLDLQGEPAMSKVEVTPERLGRGILFTLGLATPAGNIRYRCRAAIPFEGFVWTSRSGHQRTKLFPALTVAIAAGSRIRSSPPIEPGEELERFALMEGRRLVRRLRESSLPLGQLRGLGDALRVWRGPYNESEHSLDIAGAVIDGGLIKSLRISDDKISLFPPSAANLRDDFRTFAWVGSIEDGMRFEELPLSEIEAGDEGGHKAWQATHEFGNISINAVGIFLGATLVGSWWNLPNWTRVLAGAQADEDPEGYGRVMRVFKCPLMHWSTRRFLKTFVAAHPGELFSSWIPEEIELDLGLGFAAGSAGTSISDWRRATGDFLEDCHAQFDLAGSSAIIEMLAPDFTPGPRSDGLIHAAETLVESSPVLCTLVLENWLREFVVPDFGRPEATRLAREVAEALAPSEESLEDFCENVARTDPYFIDVHCNAFAEAWPPRQEGHFRWNLKLLFEHEIIRRAATARRLERVSRTL